MAIMLKRKIEEILTPRVFGVSPEETAAEVLALMRERNISCALILRDGRPAGIFTERNATRYLAARGLAFLDLPIRDIMSSPVLSVTGETYIYEAFNILGHSKIRHLAVVDEDGRARGMVTQSNLILHLGGDYFREVRRIDQIMSKLVFTVPPSYPLRRALTEMADKSISCMVAAEKDKPLGMFTERDVVRLALDRRDPVGLTIGDVMRGPVTAIKDTATVREASDLMRIQRIRRLVVVDREGRIVGLSTQSNLIKGLEGKYVETLKEVIREKETELRHASEDLREKTVYLDNILRSAIDMGIVAAGVDMRVNYYNPAAEMILGRPAPAVVGRRVEELHEELGVPRRRLDDAFAAVGANASHAFEFEASGNGEGPRSVAARVSGIFDEQGRHAGMVLMLTDVTERKKAEEIIRRLAYHDPLTDLPNRALFNDRLQVALARARRGLGGLVLAMLDLDGFKAINDTMGHHAGDMLLVALARRFKTGLRESDAMARMGGDEFMFLFTDVASPPRIDALSAKILSMVEEPFEIDGRSVRLEASLGTAVYPEDGTEADALMRRADGSMYEQKKRPRRRDGAIPAAP